MIAPTITQQRRRLCRCFLLLLCVSTFKCTHGFFSNNNTSSFLSGIVSIVSNILNVTSSTSTVPPPSTTSLVPKLTPTTAPTGNDNTQCIEFTYPNMTVADQPFIDICYKTLLFGLGNSTWRTLSGQIIKNPKKFYNEYIMLDHETFEPIYSVSLLRIDHLMLYLGLANGVQCQSYSYCGSDRYSADCTNLQYGRKVTCELAEEIFFPFTVSAALAQPMKVTRAPIRKIIPTRSPSKQPQQQVLPTINNNGHPSIRPTIQPKPTTKSPIKVIQLPSSPSNIPSPPTNYPIKVIQLPSSPSKKQSPPTKYPIKVIQLPSSPSKKPSPPTNYPIEVIQLPSSPSKKPSPPTKYPTKVHTKYPIKSPISMAPKKVPIQSPIVRPPTLLPIVLPTLPPTLAPTGNDNTQCIDYTYPKMKGLPLEICFQVTLFGLGNGQWRFMNNTIITNPVNFNNDYSIIDHETWEVLYTISIQRTGNTTTFIGLKDNNVKCRSFSYCGNDTYTADCKNLPNGRETTSCEPAYELFFPFTQI